MEVINKYDISVVIPCYNAEKTIEKCIESVLAQTLQPLEIVIVDDGSKDKSVEIISNIIDNSLVNIILICQINSGPSATRNNGVAKSRGNWIAFLDSDDCWLPDKLLNQVEFLKNVNQDIKLLGSKKLKKKGVYFLSLNRLLFKNFFITSSVLVDKKVFLEFGFNTKQKYSEDYLCWLQITSKYLSAVISHNDIYPIFEENGYTGRGLSSNIKKMEYWELSNYFYLLKNGHVNFIIFTLAICFSIMKFCYRLIEVFLKNYCLKILYGRKYN